MSASPPENRPSIHSPHDSSSLFNASSCTFEPYKQASYGVGQGLQRPYGGAAGVPQAGYTSVIVDAQQYQHLQQANGYVH